jgi:hypothetical protein
VTGAQTASAVVTAAAHSGGPPCLRTQTTTDRGCPLLALPREHRDGVHRWDRNGHL